MNQSARRVILIGFAAILLVFAVIPLWDYVTYRMAIASYSGYVARISGIVPLNKYLLDAIATAFASLQVLAWTLILRSYLGGMFGPLPQKRRHAAGFAILFCITIGEDLSFYAFTHNRRINPKTGESMAFFCITRSGVEWMPQDGYCPNGQHTTRLTPANSDVIDMLSRGPFAKICPPHGGFFNAYTSQPEVWYSRGQDGECEFFNLPAYNPTTGERLAPVGRNIEDECKRSLDKCRGENGALQATEPALQPTGPAPLPAKATPLPTEPAPATTEAVPIEAAPPPAPPPPAPPPHKPALQPLRNPPLPLPALPRPKVADVQGMEVTLRACYYRSGDLHCEVTVENRTAADRVFRLGSLYRTAARLEYGGVTVAASSAQLSSSHLLAGHGAQGSLDFRDIPPGFARGKLVLTVDLGFTKAEVGFPLRSVWVDE
jgi:hypothetical protein